MTMTFALFLLNLCLFFANWYFADKNGSKFSYLAMAFNGFTAALLVFKMGGLL